MAFRWLGAYALQGSSIRGCVKSIEGVVAIQLNRENFWKVTNETSIPDVFF